MSSSAAPRESLQEYQYTQEDHSASSSSEDDHNDERREEDDDDNVNTSDEEEEEDKQVHPSQQKPLQLSKESLERFQEREKQKGIIYLSRIPPYMKPQKVRHLLEVYGKIDRIYLAPEDPVTRKRRIKSGGNRKRKYTEGWVEFMDKRVAKRVAMSLNNTSIGTSGRKFFDSDLWNMKYLKGFKWSYLTEKLNCERQLQAQKLRTEISQAKKENEFYMSKVDQAKKIEKAMAKQDADKKQNKSEEEPKQTFKPRHFPQKQARQENQSSSSLDSELLRKIAGGNKKQKQQHSG